MCGLVGIVAFGDPHALGTKLRRMNDGQAHRGPDDEGYALVDSAWVPSFFAGDASPREIRERLPPVAAAVGAPARAGLAHRRFAILDPTPDGHQPWYDTRGATLLAYNGEIYNYLELREELERLGHGPFRSRCDTEVLAVAYRAWGAECFRRLNGFWAVAILDLARKRLLLSRDRFGKKPLYLHRPDPQTLLFASEIRPILEAGGGRESFAADPEAVLLYLLYDRRNTLKGCLWRDIELLPAGVARTVDLETGVVEEATFWTFPAERLSEAQMPFEEALVGFRARLEEAVRLRLRSDVPLAANLSGGMDSSSIVAVAQHALGAGRRLAADHVRYADAPQLDEYTYARAVADRVGCEYRELFLSLDESMAELDRLVGAFEEPVHSMAFFTQWLQWRAIARSGVRVVLHGAGGDELLAGYPWLTDFVDFGALARLDLKRYFASCRPWNLRAHLRTAKGVLAGQALPQVSNPVRRILGLPDRREEWRDYHPRQFARYFAPGFLSNTGEFHRVARRRFADADADLTARLRAEFDFLRIPFWCNAMDKSMMSIPIEVRMPFLDYRLVEFTSRLPIRYLYDRGWSKYILRCAVQGLLPREVVWRRRKVGFSIPTRRWLDAMNPTVLELFGRTRDTLGAFVRTEVVRERYRHMPADLLWRVVNLAKWLETFRPRVEV